MNFCASYSFSPKKSCMLLYFGACVSGVAILTPLLIKDPE
jgi:hypothetical protein